MKGSSSPLQKYNKKIANIISQEEMSLAPMGSVMINNLYYLCGLIFQKTYKHYKCPTQNISDQETTYFTFNPLY